MTENGEDRLLEHEYDGIQEYDNPMPRWWLWIFYASIAFSVAYYFLPAPFGEGEGVIAEYEREMASASVATPPPTGTALSNEELLALAAAGSAVEEGKVVYDANCAACHRADGGGLIGPNLADSYYIHGGSPMEIHQVIAEGVLAKGMPAWDRILSPDQLNKVTVYVLSMHGTNPPDAKAPEGSEVLTGL